MAEINNIESVRVADPNQVKMANDNVSFRLPEKKSPVEIPNAAEVRNKTAKSNSVARPGFNESQVDLLRGIEKRTALREETRNHVVKVISHLNSEMIQRNRLITFSVDDRSGTMVIKVIRSDTNSVIKQIPAQQLLDLANDLDQLKGLIFDENY